MHLRHGARIRLHRVLVRVVLLLQLHTERCRRQRLKAAFHHYGRALLELEIQHRPLLYNHYFQMLLRHPLPLTLFPS